MRGLADFARGLSHQEGVDPGLRKAAREVDRAVRGAVLESGSHVGPLGGTYAGAHGLPMQLSPAGMAGVGPEYQHLAFSRDTGWKGLPRGSAP